MKLSNLQKFILLECYNSKTGRINRSRLVHFYDNFKASQKPDKKLQIQIITKSLQRLIDKKLLVGFGERTKHKWFIKDIKITSAGKHIAKQLLGQQLSLPLNKRKIKKIINN